jgi:hypothetical protein
MTAPAKTPRPKRASKPRKPAPEPQAPLPLTFGATPRIIVGIDPGAVGAAVILRCGTSGPPALVAAVTWTERQRKTGTVYAPTWWPATDGWLGPDRTRYPTTLHKIGAALAETARIESMGSEGADGLPIHAAVERQYSGRFAAAGLGVAWLAGLIAGPIIDVAAHVGRPAPAEWRAVAAPLASQRRKKATHGDVKPCPRAMGAQLAGGWPADLLAAHGLPADSDGSDLPVDLGEALGIALWAAAKTA